MTTREIIMARKLNEMLRTIRPLTTRRSEFRERLNIFCDEYEQSIGEPGAYRDFIRKVEKETVLYSLEQSRNNMVNFAKALGVHRSSAYSLCNRLGVKAGGKPNLNNKGDLK